MKKKLIAVIAVAAMLVAMVPSMVFATGGNVAKIGTTEYPTLNAAIAAAEDGDTIYLIDDIDISAASVVVNKEITLDMNGHNIIGANTENGSIKVTGELTFTDSQGEGVLTATKDYLNSDYGYGIIRVVGGKLIMNGGKINTVRSDAANKGQFGVTVGDGGEIVFNDGEIKSGWYALSSNGTDNTNMSISVNGGELISTADYAIYGPSKNLTIEINDGVVYGDAGGIAMRNGKLVVNDGVITSKGKGNTGNWGDGTGNLSNAAVNIDAQYGKTVFEANGGKFIAEGNAVVVQAGSRHDKELVFNGGEYNSDISELLNPEAVLSVEYPDADENSFGNPIFRAFPNREAAIAGGAIYEVEGYYFQYEDDMEEFIKTNQLSEEEVNRIAYRVEFLAFYPDETLDFEKSKTLTIPKGNSGIEEYLNSTNQSLPELSAEGYKFIGWYAVNPNWEFDVNGDVFKVTNPSYTEKANMTAPVTDDAEYFAKWEKVSKADAPKTGDESNMMLPITIALIALAGIATVVVTRRKHN